MCPNTLHRRDGCINWTPIPAIQSIYVMCFTNPLRPGLTVLFHRIYRFLLTARRLCWDPARAAETGVSFRMENTALTGVTISEHQERYSSFPNCYKGILPSVTWYTCFWICICWNITWLLTWRYSYHLSCLLERSLTLQAQGHKVFDDRNDEEGQIQTI